MGRTTRKNKQYVDEDVKEALSLIKKGRSVHSASIQFGVPFSTFFCKATGKLPIDKRPDAPTILTSDEEKPLVAWVIHVSKCGFPVTKIQLLKSLVMIRYTL